MEKILHINNISSKYEFFLDIFYSCADDIYKSITRNKNIKDHYSYFTINLLVNIMLLISKIKIRGNKTTWKNFLGSSSLLFCESIASGKHFPDRLPKNKTLLDEVTWIFLLNFSKQFENICYQIMFKIISVKFSFQNSSLTIFQGEVTSGNCYLDWKKLVDC